MARMSDKLPSRRVAVFASFITLCVAAGCHSAPSARSPQSVSRRDADAPASNSQTPARDSRASGEFVQASAEAARQDIPIDLATALRLAGANNLQIQFTRDRVQEAGARLEAAQVLWLPSLTAGPGYNKHDGRIQATEGEVVEVSRNATVVGTSPTMILGGGPISTIDITDAIFEPLAACQIVRASQAAVSRTTNDMLLAVALAYLDLVEAELQRTISQQDVENAGQLVQLTESFAKAGQGLESDAARARSELATRQREVIAADEAVQVRSVRLANLLRLDPSVTLHTMETNVTPIEMISQEDTLAELISRAQAVRPENEEHSALMQAAYERTRQERMRPFMPRLLADVAAGGFGGGEGSHVSQFSDRTDVTVLAVWELRNMGLGNRALQRQREAQQLQAATAAQLIQDLISAEVTEAYHQVHERRRQIEVAQKSVEESLNSLELNMNRIRGAEGLPIEVLQAIQSVAAARRAYLATVTNYNRAQFQLLRAVGQPPTIK